MGALARSVQFTTKVGDHWHDVGPGEAVRMHAAVCDSDGTGPGRVMGPGPLDSTKKPFAGSDLRLSWFRNSCLCHALEYPGVGIPTLPTQGRVLPVCAHDHPSTTLY
eukprot:1129606-Rhodomonas_salina.3